MRKLMILMSFAIGSYFIIACNDDIKNTPGPIIEDSSPSLGIDQRSYQHGIDFLPLSDGRYAVIWASSEDPLDVANSDTWEHDIYYSYVNPQSPFLDPIKIITNPEAQEPASSAISKDGHIMITMEDGHDAENVLAQRYGVYDEDFNSIKPYPLDVLDGGHSGHVAAVGNRFVVFFSEEWIEGGGVDDLGSGDDVHAAIYGSDGTLEKRKEIAVGNATRDWWPIIAGSESTALMVWQRFVDDEKYVDLKISLLNPESGDFIQNEVTIASNVKYYTYSVEYLPNIDRYLIMGVYETGGGFGILLDNNGDIVTSNLDLPEIVRESQSIVKTDGNNQIVAQPRSPNGLMIMSVSKTEISLQHEVDNDYDWQFAGTDGIWVGDNQVYIVSLSTTGAVEKIFTTN